MFAKTSAGAKHMTFMPASFNRLIDCPVSSAKKIARIQEKIKSIDPEAVEKELKRKNLLRKR